MIRRYRSKPVEIEAIQWTGDNTQKIWDAFTAANIYGPTPERNPDHLIISTLEGDMRAAVGDWIIKGTEGELHPCKDSVFQRKYEQVDS